MGVANQHQKNPVAVPLVNGSERLKQYRQSLFGNETTDEAEAEHAIIGFVDVRPRHELHGRQHFMLLVPDPGQPC